MDAQRTTVCRQTGYNPQQLWLLKRLVAEGKSDEEIYSTFEFIEPESTKAWLEGLRPKAKRKGKG